MPARITLNINLGPLVSFRIDGDSCEDILKALHGFRELNESVDEMCSDLGERMYPEGSEARKGEDQEAES